MKIFAKKVTMTHVEDVYKSLPVTVLDVSENVVAKVAGTKVLLGWGKAKHPTKAQQGNYSELGFVPKDVMEVEMDSESVKVGEFELPEMPVKVDVSGTSKGKGFAGVMKRHGFSGVGGRTHGASDRERAPGSIGAGTTPGRVLKGKKMPGRMGNERVTTKKLKVVRVVTEGDKKYVLVNGAVPGPNGGLIEISW